MVVTTTLRWKHGFDFLVCDDNVFYRVLSALEVVERVISVTGKEDFYPNMC